MRSSIRSTRPARLIPADRDLIKFWPHIFSVQYNDERWSVTAEYLLVSRIRDAIIYVPPELKKNHVRVITCKVVTTSTANGRGSCATMLRT